MSENISMHPCFRIFIYIAKMKFVYYKRSTLLLKIQFSGIQLRGREAYACRYTMDVTLIQMTQKLEVLKYVLREKLAQPRDDSVFGFLRNSKRNVSIVITGAPHTESIRNSPRGVAYFAVLSWV